jgi:outer membrane lipoprotein-sorting protein
MDLLVATVILCQDKTAEDTFRKIEETIQKAKTLSIKFHFKAAKLTSDEELELDGTFLSKDGNRIRLECSTLRGELKRELPIIVSDGSRVASFADGKIRQEKEASHNFNATLAVLTTRGGVVSLMAGIQSLLVGEKKDTPNAGEAMSITEIEMGEDDGAMKTLNYKTVIKLPPSRTASVEVRLWYEPESLKLVKRTMSHKGKSGSGTITETYNEFTINADIPDEKFKVPEEKK